MREALFYKQLEDNKVKCKLCPHECIIAEDKSGLCLGRENKDGKLYATNYGKTISLSMDPVEKKPLYHFYPGENILSIGPNGCNLRCKFCQNYTSSQEKVPTRDIDADQLLSYCKQNDSIGVAYTYTEPLIWYEYILDTAKILHENDKKVVLVTNGTINEEPLRKILPFVDAMNIDLKSMEDDFYKKVCSGFLEPVKNTIKTASKETHIEITNLVIPEYNDADENLNTMIDFLQNINPDIPLHISRYFPAYKLQAAPTPSSTLKKIYKMAKKRLNHVYIGNINIKNTMNTTCPECSELLIKRQGYFGIESKITKENTCHKCGHKIYGEHLYT
ncbi:MAG: AmmeMemoRadiSam system radical SAM enzyme [Candidatus Cloacimonetes bacterium]|nr:AmmeMemoRadiSam system radical SAM enzyme [Candidatus Cloacimonadota bacterium]MBS3767875.1 AmmeMemoRadiSam system radical SAM enzyme [Candidatus Cloacimonadota bacterium]